MSAFDPSRTSTDHEISANGTLSLVLHRSKNTRRDGLWRPVGGFHASGFVFAVNCDRLRLCFSGVGG